MGTTDSLVAERTLEAFAESGIRFALLHGEERLGTGSISDLDLVVDLPPNQVPAAARKRLDEAGLRPILVWPYDLGETRTVFLATPDARQGVQVDLLYDPAGRGKYGLRSGTALDHVTTGARWPTLVPEAELLYLLRKRLWKGQPDRLEVLLSRAREFSREDLRRLADRIFSPRAAGELKELLEVGGAYARRPVRPRGHRARRTMVLGKRIARPIGVWVEVVGAEAERTSRGIGDRFGSLLPHAEAVRSPQPAFFRPAWWARRVVPVRWRPGLIVSWSSHPTVRPQADITLSGDRETLDEACRRVVEGMARRVGW